MDRPIGHHDPVNGNIRISGTPTGQPFGEDLLLLSLKIGPLYRRVPGPPETDRAPIAPRAHRNQIRRTPRGFTEGDLEGRFLTPVIRRFHDHGPFGLAMDSSSWITASGQEAW